MSDDEKIYVDASRPATLNSGGGVLDDCPTLQEAVMAWHRRPSRRKGRRSKFLADRFILRRRSSGSTTDTSRECDAPPLPATIDDRGTRCLLHRPRQGPASIAKTLKIGWASVYRALAS
jgi:hypothetical protein